MTDKKSANEFLNPIEIDGQILRAEKTEILDQAIQFSKNLLLGHQQLTGESTLSHSDSVCQIVEKNDGKRIQGATP